MTEQYTIGGNLARVSDAELLQAFGVLVAATIAAEQSFAGDHPFVVWLYTERTRIKEEILSAHRAGK